MNITKWLARHHLLVAVILSVITIASCGPAPLGTGWPAVSLLTSECGGDITDNVMVAFNDRIVLINPADGKASILLNQNCEPRPPDADGKAKVWDFRGNAPNLFFAAPVRLNDETLLTVAHNQHVYEIDLVRAASTSATGTPINGRTGTTVAEPLLNGDLMYLGLGNRDLVALDINDYSVLWTVETEHGVWAKPLLLDNTLYFTSLDHFLYAVDSETGDLQWKLDLEGAITSTPFYDDMTGHLFVGSFARKIFEISRDGQIINQYETVDWLWGTPTIVNGVLYAADLAGSVYALDVTENLREIWAQQPAERAIRATPVVAGDVVIVASRDHKLYWLNRANGSVITDGEGQPLVRDVGAEILSDVLLLQPTDTLKIAEPYVVVSTLAPDKLLVAYTLSRAEQKWAYALQ